MQGKGYPVRRKANRQRRSSWCACRRSVGPRTCRLTSAGVARFAGTPRSVSAFEDWRGELPAVVLPTAREGSALSEQRSTLRATWIPRSLSRWATTSWMPPCIAVMSSGRFLPAVKIGIDVDSVAEIPIVWKIARPVTLSGCMAMPKRLSFAEGASDLAAKSTHRVVERRTELLLFVSKTGEILGANVDKSSGSKRS